MLRRGIVEIFKSYLRKLLLFYLADITQVKQNVTTFTHTGKKPVKKGTEEMCE
jgi:hypothetical protein